MTQRTILNKQRSIAWGRPNADPDADEGPDPRQYESMANKSPSKRALLCPERQPDADFSSPPRHPVRNHAVDTDNAEHECHAPGNGEQHESERGSRHGA